MRAIPSSPSLQRNITLGNRVGIWREAANDGGVSTVPASMLDNDADQEQLEFLLKLTERYQAHPR